MIDAPFGPFGNVIGGAIGNQIVRISIYYEFKGMYLSL